MFKPQTMHEKFKAHLKAGGTFGEWYAPEELAAFRADLEAVAVAGERVTKGAVMYAAGEGDTLFNVGIYDLKIALSRPGVRAVLEGVKDV